MSKLDNDSVHKLDKWIKKTLSKSPMSLRELRKKIREKTRQLSSHE